MKRTLISVEEYMEVSIMPPLFLKAIDRHLRTWLCHLLALIHSCTVSDIV
jgi:hypothetical protein